MEILTIVLIVAAVMLAIMLPFLFVLWLGGKIGVW